MSILTCNILGFYTILQVHLKALISEFETPLCPELMSPQGFSNPSTVELSLNGVESICNLIQKLFCDVSSSFNQIFGLFFTDWSKTLTPKLAGSTFTHAINQ